MKNKLFEFLFLGTSFCFSEIMKKDLDIFHSGADLFFLFHLGKRKEILEMEIKLFQE